VLTYVQMDGSIYAYTLLPSPLLSSPFHQSCSASKCSNCGGVTPDLSHTLPTMTANLNPQSTTRLQYECLGQRLFTSPDQVKCTRYQCPVLYSHVTPFAAVLSSLVTLDAASRRKRLDGSQAQQSSLGALRLQRLGL
jgi:hypothetical protein